MRANEGINCTKVCSSVSFSSLTHFNAPSPSVRTFFIMSLSSSCLLPSIFLYSPSTCKNSPFSLQPPALPLLIWVSTLSVWPSLNDSACTIRISLWVLASVWAHCPLFIFQCLPSLPSLPVQVNITHARATAHRLNVPTQNTLCTHTHRPLY